MNMTNDEFEAVTSVFVSRLSEEMARAGCNDLCERDGFPKSISLLGAWADDLNSRIIRRRN
jgi:hypothetical protein